MTVRTWDTSPISIEGINGWDSTHVAVRGEKFCPWWLTYLNPTTGDVFDYRKPCRSFSHRPCAEKRVAVLLDHIGTFILSSGNEFWVAAGQDDDGLATRMRVRRSKSKERTGEEVHAFWIRRNTGVFYYFATASLPGISEPSTGAWVGSETAFTVARAALTLPGVGDPQGRKGVIALEDGSIIHSDDRQYALPVQKVQELWATDGEVPEVVGKHRAGGGIEIVCHFWASWGQEFTLRREMGMLRNKEPHLYDENGQEIKIGL